MSASASASPEVVKTEKELMSIAIACGHIKNMPSIGLQLVC
jgi:hypothetical protein